MHPYEVIVWCFNYEKAMLEVTESNLTSSNTVDELATRLEASEETDAIRIELKTSIERNMIQAGLQVEQSHIAKSWIVSA